MTKGDPAPVIGARVTVTVPCWNQLDWTKRLWESVRRFILPGPIPTKWVFINNGSEDGTEEWLNALAYMHENVFVIHNRVNLGFLKAMNQGRELCEGHWLWLNNDTEFLRPSDLPKLVEHLESNPLIGAVGPVSDGVMGPQNIRENAIHPQVHEVRFLIGFFMLIKDGVWQRVGKLDERFHNIGNDDLDYSFSIRKLGLKLLCVRRVLIHHVAGGTQPYTPEWQHAVGPEGGMKVLKEKWGKLWMESCFQPLSYAKHRVLIAIPTISAIYPEAYANHILAITNEIKRTRVTELSIGICILARNTINRARQKAAEMAVSHGFTHLMFLDDDMLCPEGFIQDLLKWEVDIVSGLAHVRVPPHHPAVFIDHEDPKRRQLPIKSWPKDKVIEVDNVGAACMLISTNVFRKIGTDVFQFTPHTKDHKGNIVRLGLGEDIFFCREARKAGFKVYVDTSVKFGHLTVPLSIDSDYYHEYMERHPEHGENAPLVPYRTPDQARAWVVDFYEKVTEGKDTKVGKNLQEQKADLQEAKVITDLNFPEEDDDKADESEEGS